LRRFAKYLLLGKKRLLSVRPPEELPAALRDQWRRNVVAARAHLQAWPDPGRAEIHFNAFESWDYALESLNAEKYGLEVRSPYRDWELVQFVLSTPLHLMAGPLGYKWLQKQAIAPYLDIDWLNRPKCGSLYPILERYYADRKPEALRKAKSASQLLAEVSRIPEDLEKLFDSNPYRATNLVHFLSWTESPWNSGQNQE
jgi:asparagine synthetase B (glutamine-hydrolysing)